MISVIFISCSLLNELWMPSDINAALDELSDTNALLAPVVKIVSGPSNSGAYPAPIDIVLQVDKNYGYFTTNGMSSNRFTSASPLCLQFNSSVILSFWGSSNGISSAPRTLFLTLYSNTGAPLITIIEPYEDQFLYTNQTSFLCEINGTVENSYYTKSLLYYSTNGMAMIGEEFMSNWMSLTVTSSNKWSATVNLSAGNYTVNFWLSNTETFDNYQNSRSFVVIPRLNTDTERNDLFASDIAFSADGNYLACGMPGDDRRNGSVMLYSGNYYVGKLYDEASSYVGGNLGYAVSVSGNGGTIAASAPGYFDTRHGQIQVFYQSGMWDNRTVCDSIITNPELTDNKFGCSLDISADGTTLAVGATESTTNGSVFIYTNAEATGDWILIAEIGSQHILLDTAFGCSVALSSNGSILVVGASNDNSTAGAVYVYTNEGGIWNNTSTIDAELTGTGVAAGSHFGACVDITADGMNVVAGAPNPTGSGAAYFYNCASGSWAGASETTVFTNTAMSNNLFGTSVAFSGDGSYMVIGAPNDYNYTYGGYGSAYSYYYSWMSGPWTNTGIFSAYGLSGADRFGYSTAIGNNGLIYAGSPYDDYDNQNTGDSNHGAVYFFQSPTP